MMVETGKISVAPDDTERACKLGIVYEDAIFKLPVVPVLVTVTSPVGAKPVAVNCSTV